MNVLIFTSYCKWWCSKVYISRTKQDLFAQIDSTLAELYPTIKKNIYFPPVLYENDESKHASKMSLGQYLDPLSATRSTGTQETASLSLVPRRQITRECSWQKARCFIRETHRKERNRCRGMVLFISRYLETRCTCSDVSTGIWTSAKSNSASLLDRWSGWNSHDYVYNRSGHGEKA